MDQIAGGVSFLTALGVMVLFIIMAVKFFQRERPDADSPILLAIRYGTVRGNWGFHRRNLDERGPGQNHSAAGNILPLHALGFHGLQAVRAFIALLLLWSGYDSKRRRRNGFTRPEKDTLQGGGGAAVAWQTIAGRSVSEMSAAPLATAFLLAVWAGIGLFAFWRWAATPAKPL